ncbi:hypothetical protein BC941DRAFT_422601 [Chlamydoabsidia padenii]|nr:hypothetical protein BC941DRAFT_422601 [Chlamydoabsidia padenii]
MAKAEEDKRRAAEEVRRTEEARLQCKYLDLGWGQQKRYSDPSTFTNEFLSGSLGSLAVSSTEALPDWLSIPQNNTMTTLSPSPMTNSISQFGQTPPSPTTSYYRAPSPFTTASFDTPLADLTLSASDSPEDSTGKRTLVANLKNNTPSGTNMSSTSSSSSSTTPRNIDANTQQQQIHQYQQQSNAEQDRYSFLGYPPPLSDNEPATTNVKVTNSSCKRTLSRTRSQRRPVVAPGKKKNRSIPLPEPAPIEHPPQPSHETVMEALRAKLRRSSNPPLLSKSDPTLNNNNLIWPTSLEQIDHPPQPMSPQGMLLLDLKNPRKIFTNNNNKRTTLNQKVVLRRPKPFTSAHNHCEKNKDGSTTAPVSTK